MTAKKIDPKDAGLPHFRFKMPHLEHHKTPLTLFDLPSHARACRALEFGLTIPGNGFNIFVIGEDRSGRMSALKGYLSSYVKSGVTPSDWVYVYNFNKPHQPLPVALPAQQGRALQECMTTCIKAIQKALSNALNQNGTWQEVDNAQQALQEDFQEQVASLRHFAGKHFLEIQQDQDNSFTIVTAKKGKPVSLDALTASEHKTMLKGWEELQPKLKDLLEYVRTEREKIAQRTQEIKNKIALDIIEPHLKKVQKEYKHIPELKTWFLEMQQDMLTHLKTFEIIAEEKDDSSDIAFAAQTRYAVNLFVEQEKMDEVPIVLDPNPGYEALFGSVKYRANARGGFETDVTMIYPGSLHRANGGFLVLRAESIAQYPLAWERLKEALRDQEIRLEEIPQVYGVPVLDTPSPLPIPLNVQLVVIGAPRWYYSFFYSDPDFQTHFKIKADIDNDMPANPESLEIYATLIQQAAQKELGALCDKEALELLLAFASRWADHREKLTARFELILDDLHEAKAHGGPKTKVITKKMVQSAINGWRDRNGRIRHKIRENFIEGIMGLDMHGEKVGQINGLVVQTIGPDRFGMPCRITARTYIGKTGIINIEQIVDLGGSIHQKGVLILEGLLNGMFAQHFPLSLGCSITFEQNYGEVEGDSASLAEYCAIISSLSGLPIRQDIAVTGSINQMGVVQAIGGLNEKIEGFFDVCQDHRLTGSQGVLFPSTNEKNLVLDPRVIEAMEEKKFFLWSVRTVDEALELVLGIPVGDIHTRGTIYGEVFATLSRYNYAARVEHPS